MHCTEKETFLNFMIMKSGEERLFRVIFYERSVNTLSRLIKINTYLNKIKIKSQMEACKKLSRTQGQREEGYFVTYIKSFISLVPV